MDEHHHNSSSSSSSGSMDFEGDVSAETLVMSESSQIKSSVAAVEQVEEMREIGTSQIQFEQYDMNARRKNSKFSCENGEQMKSSRPGLDCDDVGGSTHL